ncbi:MAG: fatty acid desaturase [Gammaproteobacteria bacterium]|jgi:stearoyl-CoA desaturase (delta-9 desaturase)|nr:fatty acid desaturase [Gammaproteobacteria bacterium]
MAQYINGLLNLNAWQLVAVAIGFIQFTMMAVTLYLHRDQAHRAINLHPALRQVFRFWLWFATGMHTNEWVAVHRKHHAMCEREGDPHSPQVFGLRKVLLEGAELYKAETQNRDTIDKYARGTPDDWIQRHLYWRYPNLGITLFVLMCIMLFGAPGIIVLGVQLISIPVFAAGVINGLGHHTGYRNFETADAATNLVPWGLWIGGEELHNNHHAFPTSAKFSVRPWEFDIGWMYIVLFRAVGLCEVRRLAPKPGMRTNPRIDLQTLQAVLVNRMHVLRDYTRTVTLAEFHEERRRLAASGNALLQRARKLLVRRPERLDPEALSRLDELLAKNARLRQVHEFREQLVGIWEQANVSNEHLLEQLKAWCAEAEASGIRSLEEFSARLRAYMLQPAAAT